MQQAGNENDRQKTWCRGPAADADTRRKLKNTGKPQDSPVGKLNKRQEHVVKAAHYEESQKNDDAKSSHPGKLLGYAGRKQTFQYVTAIEGRDGQEIEPCQHQVGTDAAEQHLQREVA